MTGESRRGDGTDWRAEASASAMASRVQVGGGIEGLCGLRNVRDRQNLVEIVPPIWWKFGGRREMGSSASAREGAVDREDEFRGVGKSGCEFGGVKWASVWKLAGEGNSAEDGICRVKRRGRFLTRQCRAAISSSAGVDFRGWVEGLRNGNW